MSISRLCRFPPRLSEWSQPRLRSDDAYDFINQLFAYDPDKRLTAAQAMRHKWFQNPQDPPTPKYVPLTSLLHLLLNLTRYVSRAAHSPRFRRTSSRPTGGLLRTMHRARSPPSRTACSSWRPSRPGLAHHRVFQPCARRQAALGASWACIRRRCRRVAGGRGRRRGWDEVLRMGTIKEGHHGWCVIHSSLILCISTSPQVCALVRRAPEKGRWYLDKYQYCPPSMRLLFPLSFMSMGTEASDVCLRLRCGKLYTFWQD